MLLERNPRALADPTDAARAHEPPAGPSGSLPHAPAAAPALADGEGEGGARKAAPSAPGDACAAKSGGSDPVAEGCASTGGGGGYDGVLLRKAVDLAERLLPAFDTPSGLPTLFLNLQSVRLARPRQGRGMGSAFGRKDSGDGEAACRARRGSVMP